MDAHKPLLPLTEADLIAARKAARAMEQQAIEGLPPPPSQGELEKLREGAQKGLRLWPDIRPGGEKRPDLSGITRDIARGS